MDEDEEEDFVNVPNVNNSQSKIPSTSQQILNAASSLLLEGKKYIGKD